MNYVDLEKILDSSFGAIIVVHIFGNPARMDQIMKIADRFDLPVIEDCAEAHGAQFQGKPVGSFGIAGCFSFYANKLIGMGEGGAISTNDENFNTKINDIKSFVLAVMVKLPFLLVVVVALVVITFTETPSNALPLLSVTIPLMLCFCAIAGKQNKVKINENKMSVFFDIGVVF
jgi:hypothetical protein